MMVMEEDDSILDQGHGQAAFLDLDARGRRILVLRVAPRPSVPPGLTKAERAVAELLQLGFSNAEVAQRRGVSVRTVETQVSSIYRKTGLRSRSELVRSLSHAGTRLRESDNSG